MFKLFFYYDSQKLQSVSEQQSYLESYSYFSSQKVGQSNSQSQNQDSINQSIMFIKMDDYNLNIFFQRAEKQIRNQRFEFTLFFLAYLVFYIYPIEILLSVTVLHYNGLDSGIKGLIFAFFIIQIVFKFNISFSLRGKEILDRKSIKWNYIRQIYNGRFFWDCISLLGLLIDTFSIDFPYKWITYLFFYTKIVFVIEFDRFILSYLQLNKKSLAGYKVLRLLLIILLIANLIACFFYRIAIETQDQYNRSWIKQFEDEKDSISLIYLNSLYWSVTTMTTVGYGDISPQNPMELIYTIFVMLISTVTFSYTINQVLEIISNITSAEESLYFQITHQIIFSKRKIRHEILNISI